MWRRMEQGDVATVAAISEAVHGRYSERPEIYAERLALYPQGCFIFDGQGGAAHGFLSSHPSRHLHPAPLDGLLGALPTDADSYYLHDLALLPEVRGQGAGIAALDLAIECARADGFPEVSLVAVNGADSFWERSGFIRVEDSSLAQRLESYGAGTIYMTLSLDDSP